MELDMILGKIIELTKNIYLKKPNQKAYKRSFLINTKRVAYEFWFTKTGLEICREISLMSIQYDSSLKNGDINDFKEIIKRVFENIIFNEKLFDFNLIFPPQKNILFETINSNIEIKKFSNKVWHIINNEFKKSLKNWLIIYPLSRISTDSVDFKYDGISLVNSKDKKFWNSLINKYPALKYWNPKTGKNFESDTSIFFKNPPNSWLVCEVNGTKDGAKSRASNLMRKFIGVLFSHCFKQDPSIIYHSEKKEMSYSMQLSSEMNSSYTYSPIGVLLHSLLVDLEIDNNIIEDIRSWYKKQSASLMSNRANRGAQFIQYGLTRNTELDKFIHYFISLDALFGERGNVEESIINGISQVQYEININKVNKLYKLRSALVHGGASYINDWKDIIDYKNHFRSEPLNDVQEIAMKSLVQFFDI